MNSNNVGAADSTGEEVIYTDIDDSVASSSVLTTGRHNETADHREVRMVAYWQHELNSVLWEVKNLLSRPYSSTRTMAQQIAEGGSVFLREAGLKLNGRILTLPGGMELSQATFLDFACPACGSLHGSNIYPSKGVSAKNLAKNQWYYNPQTKELFVISDNCLKNYCHGIVGPQTWARRVTAVPAPTKAERIAGVVPTEETYFHTAMVAPVAPVVPVVLVEAVKPSTVAPAALIEAVPPTAVADAVNAAIEAAKHVTSIETAKKGKK